MKARTVTSFMYCYCLFLLSVTTVCHGCSCLRPISGYSHTLNTEIKHWFLLFWFILYIKYNFKGILKYFLLFSSFLWIPSVYNIKIKRDSELEQQISVLYIYASLQSMSMCMWIFTKEFIQWTHFLALDHLPTGRQSSQPLIQIYILLTSRKTSPVDKDPLISPRKVKVKNPQMNNIVITMQM